MKKSIEYRLAGIIALLAFLIYLPALWNGFVNYDDMDYVTRNPHIRTLNMKFFHWAFFGFHAANWHPLTWLSHAADYAVWGLNPFGHHLTSVILHAINTFLVVVLAARLVDVRKGSADRAEPAFPQAPTKYVVAAVAGLLFGLHPLHVESVAWISERKDLLCALFFLLSALSYLSYAASAPGESNTSDRSYRSGTYRHYFFALIFFALALMSKPMAVSLPVVLLIIDWYPLGRIRSSRALRKTVVEKVPFAVLSLLSSVATIFAQKSGGALDTTSVVPLSARLISVPYALVGYLRKMILPLDLLPFYAYPKHISVLSPKYLLPLLIVIGITAASAVAARRRRIWPAVWCYYLVTLLPVLGIVKVGSQSMADRYTYLPSIGPFLLLGVGVAWIWGKAGTERQGFFLKVTGASVAALLVVSLSWLTVEQTRIWKNSLSLWNFTVRNEPQDVALVYYSRGYAFDEAGMSEKAIADFDKAIALDPSDYRSHIKRGLIFDRQGRLDRAIADLDTAVRLKPGSNMAHISRGILYGKAGLLDKAIDDFSRSISIDPENYAVYNDRGYALFLAGKYDRALPDFNRAVELNPGYAFSYLNRGNLYLARGDGERALSDFQKACSLKDERGCSALTRLQERGMPHER